MDEIYSQLVSWVDRNFPKMDDISQLVGWTVLMFMILNIGIYVNWIIRANLSGLYLQNQK